jgi:hypothetical protein
MRSKTPRLGSLGASQVKTWVIFAAVVTVLTIPAWAQSPTIGLGNDFEIDGNLLANSPPGLPEFGNDWLDGPAGPGMGVLNSDLLGTPKDPNSTFHPIDLTGNADQDIFASSNKVFDDPNTYEWKAGSVPQKDDIQHGLVHFSLDSSGNQWFSVAGDRRSINGDSYIDFEFLQNTLTRQGDGSFLSEGPDGGRTVGDLLVTIELVQGGSQAEFFAQQWQSDGAGGFTYVDIPIPPGAAFVASSSDSNVVTTYEAFGSFVYGINQFGEAAINLHALIPDLDECFGIATVFIRTKSSQSASSELKDFIEPLQLNLCLDVDPPVITCPPDANVPCDGSWTPEDVGVAFAEDNCDSDPAISYTDSIVPGECAQNFVIHRKWTATDACYNVATCTQLITVEDTVDPQITCPDDVTVECIGDVPPANINDVTASDNCGNVTVTHVGDVSDGKTCPEVITRTYQAEDECGNTAQCTQRITIHDMTNPQITCPDDIAVQCIEDVPPANVYDVTVSDNCGYVTVTHIGDVSDGKTCPEVITRTYQAEDPCGNTARCTQLITIDDTTKPVINSGPDDITVQCIEDVPPPDIGLIDATDNCGEVTVVHDGDVSDGNTCPEVITRTYLAGDRCANTTPYVQLITVDDDTPPMITFCPSNETIQCPAEPVFGIPTATDNCDPDPEIVVVARDSVPGPTAGSYAITVTWEAVDDCDNASTECSQTITVECPDEEFCTRTQGFYGNEGGKIDGLVGTYAFIRDLLSGSPLVVGKDGRSLTIPYEGAGCIIKRLPAGSTPTYMPPIGNATMTMPDCQTSPTELPLDKNGKFVNVLLGQTITLSLNVRYDPGLPSFGLSETFCTQSMYSSPATTSAKIGGAPNQAPMGMYTISSNVLSALSDLGLPQTVGGLLELANRALADWDRGGAGFSDINNAVDTINRAFDECKSVVPCLSSMTSGASRSNNMRYDTEEAQATQIVDLELPNTFELKQNYPNPFNPNTRITLALPDASSWSLNIYNVNGRLVRSYQGNSGGPAFIHVEWDGRDASGQPVATGVYLYKATAGSFTAVKKMVLLK